MSLIHARIEVSLVLHDVRICSLECSIKNSERVIKERGEEWEEGTSFRIYSSDLEDSEELEVDEVDFTEAVMFLHSTIDLTDELEENVVGDLLCRYGKLGFKVCPD